MADKRLPQDPVVAVYLNSCGDVVYGPDRGLKPVRIASVETLRGKRWFSVQWQNSEMSEMVPATLMSARYPEIVMEYYQRQIHYLP